ncbi:hypothetical protein EC844_12837 [Acinetobacter calcoaceticus]|uniref:Tetratricopeptide repeat protein n=1 Tax=Acinetobacter calcoaceticus TaxID=471 RepID=A0A4R1XEJ0_ACICA|nr:hypothetical protein EC844_12837 [Acinetobacter calcoaceticus]
MHNQELEQLFNADDLEMVMEKVIGDYLNDDNFAAVIEYVEQRIANQIDPLQGLCLLVGVYEYRQDDHRLLLSLDRAITFAKHLYSKNRELRDLNVSKFWLKKIYLLQRRYKNAAHSGEDSQQAQQIVQEIEQGLDSFVSHDEIQLFDLAEIAYEYGNIGLVQKILAQLREGLQQADSLHSKLLQWYQRLNQYQLQGDLTPDIEHIQLLLEANYAEILSISPKHYYQHALKIIERNPHNAEAEYYVGLYLYKQQQFEQARSYLRKSLQKKVDIYTWGRLIETEYLLDRSLPEDIPNFSDNTPRELYNEGVNQLEFVAEILNHTVIAEEVSTQLKQICCEIFSQAYLQFKAYFEQNIFASDRYINYQLWAECCNQYATQLGQLNQTRQCAEIASEGLNYAEHVGLRFNLLAALMNGKEYQSADQALAEYFSRYSGADGQFYSHQIQRAHQLMVDFYLGRKAGLKEKCQAVLFELYQHQPATELNEFDRRDFVLSKIFIENIICDLSELDDVQTCIAYYEGIAAEYPKESFAHYMLMQEYDDQAEYLQVKQHSSQFLIHMDEVVMDDDESNLARHLYIKSCLMLEQYQDAIQFFLKHEADIDQTMEQADYVQLLSKMIQIYASTNYLDKIDQLILRVEDMYLSHAWPDDQLKEKIYLAHAELLYKNGNLKAAHQRLNQVLSYDDHDPQADQFKRDWKKPSFFSRFF